MKIKSSQRFSIRIKLLLIFGCLLIFSVFSLGLLAMNIAKNAVSEKVEVQLKDKAQDIATIIDGRLNAFIQFLEGIARAQILQDENASWKEKALYLANEAKFNNAIKDLLIIDTSGVLYLTSGKTIDVSDREYFLQSKTGKNYFSEPYLSRSDNQLTITLSTPIYNENKQVIAVLDADLPATWLLDQIEDIVVGKTGYAFILGASGNAVAHKNFDFVLKMFNGIETAKKDKTFE